MERQIRRQGRRERLGTSTQYDSDRIQHGIKGALELAQYKKPKEMSFGHAQNVRYYVEAGLGDIERRHVLMDYEQNKQLKARMLTHQEAWKRNRVLRGTGFAWAMCSK